MKKTLILLTALALFCCKKKDTPADEPATPTTTGGATTGGTTTSGTTTGAVPTVTYVAELSATNTDYDFNRSYASAKFYTEGHTSISVASVKINNKTMGSVPFGDNAYSTSQTTLSFTPPVLWEVDSDVSSIPDTSYTAKPFPPIGFLKDPTRIYDKTKDFVVNVETVTCDSLIITLGTVVKRVPGRTGITSVTYKPADNVKFQSSDSTRVDVSVVTMNYDIFNVRSKKWKAITSFRTYSYYKFK